MGRSTETKRRRVRCTFPLFRFTSRVDVETIFTNIAVLKPKPMTDTRRLTAYGGGSVRSTTFVSLSKKFLFGLIGTSERVSEGRRVHFGFRETLVCAAQTTPIVPTLPFVFAGPRVLTSTDVDPDNGKTLVGGDSFGTYL